MNSFENELINMNNKNIKVLHYRIRSHCLKQSENSV
jgi:hypothetical protein